MDINEIFSAGEYYIGAPELVLDWDSLSKLSEGICQIKEQKCAYFQCENSSVIDNENFAYSIENSSFVLMPGILVNDEVLKTRILTIKNGVVYNKFSGFKLARILDFKNDFKVEKNADYLKIGAFVFGV